MKQYRKIIFATLTSMFLLGGLSSCSDEFFDVNSNPNQPESVPPATLLTGVQYSTAFFNANEVSRITSLWMQHIAGAANQATGYDVYNISGESYNNQWNGEMYSGILQNSQLLINQTQEKNPAYAGIAKIIKAYGFAMATDIWGDIPYSQALKALGSTNAADFTPAFDTQQDIYVGNDAKKIQSLFALVREGMADLDKPSAIRPGSDDVIYGGNVTRWKRLGNTLLMKLALTIRLQNPDLAKTVINEVLSTPGGLIVDNADDFQVGFANESGKWNPFYSFNYINRTTDQMLGQRYRDTLLLSNDPRLGRFFTPVTAANGTISYPAANNGGGGAIPVTVAGRSRYGQYIVGTHTNAALTTATGDAPVRMITNFQRAFMIAEAILTLGIAGNANTVYQEGIRASMLKAGLTTAEINAYFTANPTVVTLSGSPQRQLNQVMTQKWIANVGNGYEAWNDWRRTGFPRLAVANNAAGEDGTIPVRFPYPTNEQQRNPNCPNPGPRANVKVWWDAN